MSETVKEMVVNFCKQNKLGQNDFARLGGICTKSIQNALSGEYDKDVPPQTSLKKRVGIAEVITRLAQACGEDPQKFLDAIGLSGISIILTRRKDADKLESKLLDTQLTEEDIAFLLMVQKELKQPITVRIALELVRLRLAKDSE